MTAKTTSSSCQQPAKETETQNGKTETEKKNDIDKDDGALSSTPNDRIQCKL